jgi:hypothetical protein
MNTNKTKTEIVKEEVAKTEILKQLKKLSLEEVAGVIQSLEEKCMNATMAKHEAIPEGDNYALFVYQPTLPPMRSLMDIFGGGKEERSAEEIYRPKDLGKTLVFVKMSKDAKELSAIIRSAPTLEYVLMRGNMMNVSAMTQVFVDGKNLNTLESEWS